MDISKFKIFWNYITGGMGKVVDYLLGLVNTALTGIEGDNKEKITGVLNICEHVIATLVALKWLCPTKWQIAYVKTIDAVYYVVAALRDFKIEKEELEKVQASFIEAIKEWDGDDDETCVVPAAA